MNPQTHNAAVRPDKAAEPCAAIFRAPYNTFAPKELLQYFGTREGIACFSVPDSEETRREKINGILRGRFEFNGEEHLLPPPIHWLTNPSTDVEWHILLHKFYYAVGLALAFQETGDKAYLKKWVSLTSSWIDQTPPGFIASDVTGRRIQNWIYAYHHFVFQENHTLIDPEFNEKFLASLHHQVEYLIENLAPARNHRTLELYSIFLAAVVFPEFTRSKHWLDFSLAEIVNNMQTDLLDDGVQCELSTDYHNIVLKNYLCVRRLARLNDIPAPRIMDDMLIRALEFSMHIHNPSGVVPSFSDGDKRSYLDLLHQGYALFGREDMRYVATGGKEGRPPAHRSVGFSNSGYYVLRSGWGEGSHSFQDEHHLIFDCGPLGAGNHGHLDLLSFELSAFGHPLVVDPGRYTYSEAGETNWRVRFRGTAYHNTVQVDHKNQTRYEQGKRRFKIKGPEPDHELKTFLTRPGFDFIHGVAKSHAYGAVHERRIFFALGEYWIVFDDLTSGETHDYDQRFHLSQHAFQKVKADFRDESIVVSSPHLLLAQPQEEGLNIYLEKGFVSLLYGEKSPAPVLRFSRRAGNAFFPTVLYPYKSHAPKLSLRRIPVFKEDGTPADRNAQAISIHLEVMGTPSNDYCFAAPPGSTEVLNFGDWRYRGSYLFLRTDSTGRVTHLHTNPGAEIQGKGISHALRKETP